MKKTIKGVVSGIFWLLAAMAGVFIFFSLAADGWYNKAAQRQDLRAYDAGVAAGQIMGRSECRHD